MTEVGKNVKRIRTSKKISQNQLAKLAGISQPALSAIESNANNPSSVTVEMLANALGCTAAELLGESDVDETYNASERDLIMVYRSLNPQGRKYIRQQLAIAQQLYAGEPAPSVDLEAQA